MRVGCPVIIVCVSEQHIGSGTAEIRFEGNMLMKEMMEEVEVMAWFSRVDGDTGEGQEAGVDRGVVEKLAGVVSAKTTDQAADVEVAEKENFGEVSCSGGGDRGCFFGMIEWSSDTVNVFDRQLASFGS